MSCFFWTFRYKHMHARGAHGFGQECSITRKYFKHLGLHIALCTYLIQTLHQINALVKCDTVFAAALPAFTTLPCLSFMIHHRSSLSTPPNFNYLKFFIAVLKFVNTSYRCIYYMHDFVNIFYQQKSSYRMPWPSSMVFNILSAVTEIS